MKAVVQRVSEASVRIDNILRGEIGNGLLILLAFKSGDNPATFDWMINKLLNLRIFPDENDKMNLSVIDVNGSMLVISNFTLYGDVNRGFRPSFTDSAPPDEALLLYNEFINRLIKSTNLKIATGEFGAMMDVSLINSGPVTIIIEK